MNIFSRIFKSKEQSKEKKNESLNFLEIIKQARINTPLPLGIINLGNEFGEPGPHFVIVFKVSKSDYNNLLYVTNIEPIINFIPTEYYPNIWGRLYVDFGNEEQGVPFSSYTGEFHLSILSHSQILDDMSKSENFTLLACSDEKSKISPWHFNITPDAKSNIDIEIEACRNGTSLYQKLDENMFEEGVKEIEKSRTVTGQILNGELVSKQSTKRLKVKPFPHSSYTNIEFK